MTLTVRTIVTDALHDAGLVDANESPDASEAAQALSLLNRMALAWPAQGIHTGWTEVTLSDEFPLDETHRDGVTAMLARRVGEQRGVTTTLGVMSAAERGYSLLTADYKNLETLRVDDGLQGMPSQRFAISGPLYRG